jgi:hypothetical protein
VTVTPVVGKDKILFFELTRKCQGGQFLTYAGMYSAVELAQRKEFKEFLFNLADPQRILQELMIDN